MSSLSERIKEYMPCPLYMVATVSPEKEWKRYMIKYADLDKFFPKNPALVKNEYHFKPMLSKKEDGYFVFLDDMKEENILKMKLDGIIPCMEVETSPANFQVWVRFKNKMDKFTIKAVSEYLTKKYDADPGAIASSHFGRAPMFYRTTKDNKRFLVNLVSGSNIANVNIAEELLPEISRINYVKHVKRFYKENENVRDKAQLYIDRLISKGYDNLNSVDFIASIWLLRDGFYKEEIISAILDSSPNIRKRKHNEYNAIRYLNYTVEKALTRIYEKPGSSMSL